jgi:hypothetical protein
VSELEHTSNGQRNVGRRQPSASGMHPTRSKNEQPLGMEQNETIAVDDESNLRG